MGALDTAKEIVRIGSTAGLSKDVVDLLEEKSVLLAEQVATLEREKAELKSENARLKAEIAQLHQQLHDAEPAGFVESDGLLWKRTASGFDRRPYCPTCASHPVMMEFPPRSKEMWVCPANHTFDYDSKPPNV